MEAADLWRLQAGIGAQLRQSPKRSSPFVPLLSDPLAPPRQVRRGARKTGLKRTRSTMVTHRLRDSLFEAAFCAHRPAHRLDVPLQHELHERLGAWRRSSSALEPALHRPAPGRGMTVHAAFRPRVPGHPASPVRGMQADGERVGSAQQHNRAFPVRQIVLNLLSGVPLGSSGSIWLAIKPTVARFRVLPASPNCRFSTATTTSPGEGFSRTAIFRPAGSTARYR